MKKILQIFMVIAFFVLVWYFYGDEYWEFHNEREVYEQYLWGVSSELENFSFTEIDSFGNDIYLHVTPDLGLLDTLVNEIDGAKNQIFLETYIFTETRIRDAIIRAHKRWIEIKVLLENNPYQAPYLNDKHYNSLKEAWVNVQWSDPLHYSLNHAKLLIIDQKAYISTWNFSYSLFKYNRDFLVWITQKEFVEKLKELFLLDFSHVLWWVAHSNLVLSPDTSRWKLTWMLHTATTSIDFYFPYIADDDFKKELFTASQRGVKVRWIVEKKFYQENSDIIEEFLDNNIEISYLSPDKLHSKALLVDKKNLYIWSINFSRYSFDKNREIGIIMKDENILKEFIKIFQSDL